LRLAAAIMCALCLGGVASAAQMILFKGRNFQDRQLNVTGDVADLDDYDFKDKPSSIIVVSGQWALCDRKRFAGRCVTVGPGRYPDITATGIENNAMRSVRLLRDEAPPPPPPPPPPPMADLQRDTDARAAFIPGDSGAIVFRGLSVVVIVINEGGGASVASTATIALSDRMGIDRSWVSVNRSPCEDRKFPWPGEGGGAASCKKFSSGDIASTVAGATAQCQIPALKPGESVRCMATFSILYNFLAPAPEEWIFTAAVDTGRKVKESNEKNNGDGVEVKVRGDGLPPA
jgi:hypothetical protein